MNQRNIKQNSTLSLIGKLLRHPKFREQNAPCALVLSTFLLLTLSRLIDTAILGREEEYLSIILLQILIFLVPGLIFCKLKFQENDFSDRLQLRMFHPMHILLLISALFALISGCLLLNIHTGGIESSKQGFSLYETFLADSDSSASAVLYRLLAFAALPAICEEFVYRGILCTSLSSRGTVCTIAFSALYFGLLHFNPMQLPAYLFAGIVLCLVLFITQSLLACMVVHFFYNIFCLFGQTALARFYSYSGNETIFSFLLTMLLLISAAIFCGEASRIYARYAKASRPAPAFAPVALRQLPAALVKTLFPFCGILCVLYYIVVCIFT